MPYQHKTTSAGFAHKPGRSSAGSTLYRCQNQPGVILRFLALRGFSAFRVDRRRWTPV